jgi:hypothetical protein
MALRHLESVSAAVTLEGSKDDGTGCLVTRKDFFGLWMSFMDLVVMRWTGTSVFSEIVGANNYIEVFGFKSKGEEGVLIWRGDGAEGDPCSDDGKTSVPTSGEVLGLAKESFGNKIITDECCSTDGEGWELL